MRNVTGACLAFLLYLGLPATAFEPMPPMPPMPAMPAMAVPDDVIGVTDDHRSFRLEFAETPDGVLVWRLMLSGVAPDGFVPGGMHIQSFAYAGDTPGVSELRQSGMPCPALVQAAYRQGYHSMVAHSGYASDNRFLTLTNVGSQRFRSFQLDGADTCRLIAQGDLIDSGQAIPALARR